MIRGIIYRIESANECIGRAVSYLSVAMVAVTFSIIVFAYFQRGWIWMQELVTYMHGILFTSAAAYTLARDEHVRIDVFYAKFGARGKAWVNLLGGLFLLIPTCLVIAYFSFSYVADSWKILESSNESGGIPGNFILKTFILVFVTLVALQGVAIILRSGLILFGDGENSGGGVDSGGEN